MHEAIPTSVQDALTQFESDLADVRTRRMQLEELEVPDSPPVDPQQIADAAKRSDAPDKLKAVAKAVNEGRATWDDVANGRLGVTRELDELFAASGPGIAEGIEEAEEEEARLAQEEKQRQRAAARAADGLEDEDFSQINFLDNGR